MYSRSSANNQKGYRAIEQYPKTSVGDGCGSGTPADGKGIYFNEKAGVCPLCIKIGHYFHLPVESWIYGSMGIFVIYDSNMNLCMI